MAQQDAASRIVAGAITIVGLSAVWIAIVTSLPSQEELSAKVAAGTVTRAAAFQASPPDHATLDLSIPGVPPPTVPDSPSPGLEQSDRRSAGETYSAVRDSRSVQALRLKCEAEIEQSCPESLEGPARARCMERRARDLPASCQSHVRERFVKWREDRGRMAAACQEDVRRLCATMKPGDGRILQCLQEHAQEVSDRCYETLPKGTLLFRQ